MCSNPLNGKKNPGREGLVKWFSARESETRRSNLLKVNYAFTQDTQPGILLLLRLRRDECPGQRSPKEAGSGAAGRGGGGVAGGPFTVPLYKVPGESTTVRCGHVVSAASSALPMNAMAKELNHHFSGQCLITSIFCLWEEQLSSTSHLHLNSRKSHNQYG